MPSNGRELHTADFAEEVEGINIGHSGEIVENGHNARGEVGGVHLVLGGNVAQEEFGVDFLGRGDGCGH